MSINYTSQIELLINTIKELNTDKAGEWLSTLHTLKTSSSKNSLIANEATKQISLFQKTPDQQALQHFINSLNEIKAQILIEVDRTAGFAAAAEVATQFSKIAHDERQYAKPESTDRSLSENSASVCS